MSLLVPRHYKRATEAAQSIAASAVHRLDSDDWANASNVREQMQALDAYIQQRREEDPAYRLPQPSGWKIMVLILTIPEKSAGGVHIVEDAREQRALASPQGVILAMGPAAYTDPDRFKVNGELQPWHVVGDRITFVKYDAAMFQLANGQRLGFLNDTQPLSRIDAGWQLANT